MSFAVDGEGVADGKASPEPNVDDRRRAALLAGSGKFDKDVEDLFARGIAVARNGGDVGAFLRERLRRDTRS